MTFLSISIVAGVLTAAAGLAAAAQAAKSKQRALVPVRAKPRLRVPIVLFACALIVPLAGYALGVPLA
jgi:hypothetical protein